MSDEELLAGFEACTLAEFHHADHVRVAWLILQQLPLPDALARFAASLKRFAAANGRPELYHETITCAYVVLIRERIERMPAPEWDAFARANADLLSWKPSLLERYYRPETLASETARRIFMLPDAPHR
jgi:hypothetical protein